MENWDEIRTAFQVARLGTVSGAAEVLGEYKNKETLTDLERAFQVETDLQVRSAIYHAIGAVSMNN